MNVFGIVSLTLFLLAVVPNHLFAGAENSGGIVSAKQPIPLIMASDNAPLQAGIDFYKSVFKALAVSDRWDAMPLATIRKAMDRSGDEPYGGIPSTDRAEFRAKLPKKNDKLKPAKNPTPHMVPQLQRLLDTVRAPAAIIVDCAKYNPKLLKACGLYYYDRVQSRVIASSVKSFASGTYDATEWAGPMLGVLQRGIESAQREKDQQMIEELVERNDETTDDHVKGLIAIYGKGGSASLSDGFKATTVGGGLQLGFLSNSVGALLNYESLGWTGSSQGWGSVKRTSYGLGMIFRARALESLIWSLELGGGRESSIYTRKSEGTSASYEGVFVNIGPGMGLQLSEFLTMNLGLDWRWFFAGTVHADSGLTDIDQKSSAIPAVSLRAMLVL